MPRWLFELALVAVLYGLYSGLRALVGTDFLTAMANGHSILSWETLWDLAPERMLNKLVDSSTALAVASAYYYSIFHYVVTPAVLIWLYRRHSARYGRARTALAGITVLALIGFYLMPTAPPRLLPGSGITDTLAEVSDYGWWSTAGSVPSGLVHLANQYAAMPSLHVAWALWCGMVLAFVARRHWVRALGICYPILTSIVVMATGNHYFLDVLAGIGVAVLGGAFAYGMPIIRRRQAATRAAHSLRFPAAPGESNTALEPAGAQESRTASPSVAVESP